MNDRLSVSSAAEDAVAEQKLLNARQLTELAQRESQASTILGTLDKLEALRPLSNAEQASRSQMQGELSKLKQQRIALEASPTPAAGGTKRHVANESTQWKAICITPDFCRVGLPIIAFDSFATLDKQVKSSPNVKAQGVPVYRQGDLFQQVQADAGQHVVAGTSLGSGHVKLLDGHPTAKANGIPLARHDSYCLVNCNANGLGGALGKIVSNQKMASGGDPDRKASNLDAPPGERTSPYLEKLKAQKEALKKELSAFDALDEYVRFDDLNQTLDEKIASIKSAPLLGIPFTDLIPGVGELGAQIQRGTAGFAKDIVTGIGELAYEGSKTAAKMQTPAGIESKVLDGQILAENIRLGNVTPETVASDAKTIGSAIVKPVATPWEKGDYAEAITRGGLEIVTLPLAELKAGILGKFGKASQVAKAAEAAKAAEVAKAAEAAGDAAKAEQTAHAGDAAKATDGVHVEQGNPAGRAEGDKPGSASADGKNCEPGKCGLESEPVDVATGDYVQTWPVLDIPGSIPLRLNRHYRSRQSFRGVFGYKWADEWSQRLELDDQRITFNTAEGTTLVYLAPEDEVLAYNLRDGRYQLSGHRSATLRLYDRRSQHTLLFEPSTASTRPLSAIEDRNGNAIRFHYCDGRLHRIEHSDGFQLRIGHTASGLIEHVALLEPGQPERHLLQCRYESFDLLTSCHSQQFGPLQHTYNPSGYMLQWRDSDQTQVDMTYDDHGRVRTVSTPQGFYNDRFEYEALARCTHYHDAEGGHSRFYYDDNNLVVRKIDPLGNESLTEWDEFTNKLSETDPLGRVTRYSYSDAGELLTQINPDGSRETRHYDATGNLARYRAVDGSTWALTYDQRGNLETLTLPDGRQIRYRYGTHGERLEQINPDGGALRYEYDERHRLSAIEHPNGHTSQLSLDIFGRPLKHTDALGQTTRLSYAQHAHPRGSVAALTLADGAEQQWQYDSELRVQRFTDGEGRSTHYHYGAFDLLESLTQPGGQTLQLAYDKLARLVRVTNGLGQHYHYQYDLAGRLVAERDFAGTSIRYRYNAAGWLTEKHCADGARVHYHYDIASALLVRIDQQPANGPVEITRLSYDDRGHLVQVSNPNALIEYQRDAAGRVILERCNHREIRHHYGTDNGLPTILQAGAFAEPESHQQANADHPEIRWQHDHSGSLTQLQIGEHAPLALQNDALGRDIQRHSPEGFLQQQEYNRIGLLSGQRAGQAKAVSGLPPELHSHVQRDYRYDKAFNPIQIDDQRWGSSRYRYNANDQIIAAHLGSANPQRWQYDQALDLTSEALPSGKSEYGQSIEQQGGRAVRCGPDRYEYDACGRLISKTVQRNGFRPQRWSYRWNSDNRLTELRNPNGEHWRYAYDAFGRRIRKFQVIDGRDAQRIVGEEYLWSGEQLIEAAPLCANGEVLYDQATRWTYAPGSFTPITQHQNGKLSYIVADHLGSPRELLSEQGELVWSNSPNVWGLARLWKAANDDTGPVDCPFRFPGQYYDGESGLHYNRHRYYDPQTAQYLSPDPLGLGGGSRPQGYVHNPMGWVDPSGLVPCLPEKINLASDGVQHVKERHVGQALGWEHKSKWTVNNAEWKSIARDTFRNPDRIIRDGDRFIYEKILPNKIIGASPDGINLNKVRVVVESNGDLVTAFPQAVFKDLKDTDKLIFSR
ncbi:RHS repeat protein [Pseudomonas sp. PDNC002]|uniref:RHS repeat-associated core domain-containing protein n=1 Tax=Pseudomonas sp. PDNC002 TaxID=2811422 RepID=UPI001964641C|nr:RHS repeat-associated core domain-containing protein [Pseudomonas sp. PDNC002]QRY77897.1 RHS repeat protein [Pseudomonas sp. PDNC002]